VRELPVLLEQRVPYFDPSFEAMIRMQCKFAEEGYEKLSGVQRCVSCSICSSLHLPRRLVALRMRLAIISGYADPAPTRYFSDSIREDYAAGQLDAQVEGVLQEMRELAICGAS